MSTHLSAPDSVLQDHPEWRQPPRRNRRLIAGLALVLAVAAAVIAVTRPFSSGGRGSRGVADNGSPASLATVAKRTLSSQSQASGTLGYTGSYSVVNQSAGAATWLPSTGQVIREGQRLYEVAGKPVVLLYGYKPAYRLLKPGLGGADVKQLNAALVALGYASSAVLDPSSAYFGAATKRALQRLQKALGVKQTGHLELGQAVFLPRPVRITGVTATLGTALAPGTPIAQASSTTREVVVNLNASEQASVRVGDRVTITLPNNSTTPGVVTGVGKVAKSSNGGSPTVPVYITPRNPKVTGTLDQAPVQVAITTATVHRALVVPVTALLALAGGGYAVETVDARGVHQLVPVTTGLFDDADGLVQVSGSLYAGERIVVPAT
jgi:peptidoglycan hydrolase-like protein with peptidoglycan-binding domain